MDSGLPKWAARHALFAPWGILAATCALAALAGSVRWNAWDSLISVSDMVDLGIVVYAAGASLAEVIIRMAFYAIEQRQKQREKIRKEAMEAGLQEGMQVGLQEGMQVGRQEALRMFASAMILKSNQNPEASVEELVEAVTLEMQEAEKG